MNAPKTGWLAVGYLLGLLFLIAFVYSIVQLAANL
jgi:hypothetical protein